MYVLHIACDIVYVFIMDLLLMYLVNSLCISALLLRDGSRNGNREFERFNASMLLCKVCPYFRMFWLKVCRNTMFIH